MIIRRAGKWFAHQRYKETAKVNLLCFVFAGGSPTFFASWRNRFSEEINVLPVLYPFRERRISEAMPETTEELVDRFIQDNRMIFEKPWAVWGHCSGALIGFEAAYARSRQGCPPNAFVVSGCEAPAYALDRLMLSSDFSKITEQDILNDLLLFHLVDPSVIEDASFKDYFFPIYRADLEMFRRYRHDAGKKLSVPSLIMNGSDDTMVNAQRVKQWSDSFDDEPEFAEFSGEHYFINEHVEDVTERISKLVLNTC